MCKFRHSQPSSGESSVIQVSALNYPELLIGYPVLDQSFPAVSTCPLLVLFRRGGNFQD